jgi:hypothetical protein
MIALTLVTGEPGAETAVEPADHDEAQAAKLALLESLPQDRCPRLRDRHLRRRGHGRRQGPDSP